MQHFPHVPLTGWVRNSRVRVLSTLPNTVPVSPKVFDTLHDLKAKALNLHYDCLHPAFVQYGDILDEARTAIQLFRTNRSSSITNNTALEDARRSLEDATRKVRSLLVRYQFMEKLVKERRGGPQVGENFEKEVADQKWIHGVVSADARDPPESKVLLTDGTVASQAKMEVKTRQSTLRFECRELQTVSMRQDPSTLILTRPPCYIVGWTLSCRTKRPGSKTFSVKSGGILASNLTIDIKAGLWKADWRCRIYFVDRKDYDFPHLTSE